MFLLSKAVLLTAFLVGATGVSTYLIPLYLKNQKLNALFLEDKSSYNKKDTEDFRKQEQERLEKLNNLFSEISSIFKEAIELKDLLNKEMSKLFDSISSSENQISLLYKEQKSKLEDMFKAFEKLFENHEAKTKGEAELENVKYSQIVSEKFKEITSSWEKRFEEFIREIKEDPYKNNSENSGAQGGAVKKLKVKKLKKH